MDRTGTDLTLILPRDTYYQTIHALCAALPRPVSDAPEDRTRRDNAAMAAVAAMLPANADEAVLAVQYVAAAAHALDALRLGRGAVPESQHALRCSAQAGSMMRQAAAARSLLLRIQTARVKREADNVALDRGAWTEHAALHLMAEALGRRSPAPPADSAPLPDPPPQPEPVSPEQPAATEPSACPAPRAIGGGTPDPSRPDDASIPQPAATTGQRAKLLARVKETLVQREAAARRPSNGAGAAVLPVHDPHPPPERMQA